MALLQSDLRQLFPHARDDYLAALERNERLLTEAGILTDPLCLCHFLAQAAHETGGFRILSESGSYSAERLRQIFPRYFTPAQARVYARRSKAILSRAYANRMGNGPEHTGDGWRYRGRSFLQRTGRWSYADSSRRLNVDLIGNPDLLIEDFNLGLKDALLYWSDKDLGRIARQFGATHEGVLRVSKGINTGNPWSSIHPNGFADRKRIFDQVWAKYGKATITVRLDPAADGVLEEGEEGEAVRELQERLAALGYPVGEADGVFGPRTASAVAAFQAREKLTVTEPGKWDVVHGDVLASAKPFADEPRKDVTATELAEKGDRPVSVLTWVRNAFATVATFVGLDTAVDQAGVQLPQTLVGMRKVIDPLTAELKWLLGHDWAWIILACVGGAVLANWLIGRAVASYRDFNRVRA